MSFTRQDKIDLARGLDAWGVGVIEAGIPAMGRAERQTLDALHGLGLKAEILVWNRLNEADLDLCLDAGYPSLHLSVPASEVMLAGKLRKDRRWALSEVARLVARASRSGRKVSLGAEDASRSDPNFLAELYQCAVEAGATRVRYADTLGLLTPDRTAREVGALTAGLTVPLDFHGHDDFGLATANTLAAYDAGAGVLSVSLLGWGERAGNASFEEVAGILSFLRPDGPGNPGPFDSLIGLCRLAAARAGLPVPAHKALAGDAVFSHQSGIHVDGLLKDSRTYEAWPPEAFGGKRVLRLGKHSGPAALRHFAALRGVTLDEVEARQFLETLRDEMSLGPVDPDGLFDAWLGSRRPAF